MADTPDQLLPVIARDFSRHVRIAQLGLESMAS